MAVDRAPELLPEERPEPQQMLVPSEKEGISEQMAALEMIARNVVAAADHLKTIRKVAMGMSFPGDWVQFGDKLELDGPGADRIRPLLGISLRGWREYKHEWEDKIGKAYTWYYEAAVYYRGQLVSEKVIGRSSSRDKFFGYANSGWKDLSDVKEHDIRMAAYRAVNKEAVKASLGIRSIPVDYAVSELGLDPKKIKKVEFDGKNSGKSDDKDAGKKFMVKNGTVKEITERTTKTGKTVYVIHFDHPSIKKADTFSTTLKGKAEALIGKPILAKVKKTRFGYDLEEIEPGEKAEPKGKEESKKGELPGDKYL